MQTLRQSGTRSVTPWAPRVKPEPSSPSLLSLPTIPEEIDSDIEIIEPPMFVLASKEQKRKRSMSEPSEDDDVVIVNDRKQSLLIR